MPGPDSSVANTRQGAAFFVNILSITNGTHTFDSTGTGVSVTGLAGPYSIGQLQVRDLGKTVRIPANSSSGSQQRILRKVQRVDSGAETAGGFPVSNGFVGFNEGVGGAADSGSGALPSGFETFYIELNGTAGDVRWARLSF